MDFNQNSKVAVAVAVEERVVNPASSGQVVVRLVFPGQPGAPAQGPQDWVDNCIPYAGLVPAEQVARLVQGPHELADRCFNVSGAHMVS